MTNTAVLYGLAVLIWGSTWLAITFQLGTVPPEVSVFYRFVLAAALMAVFCLLTRKNLRFPLAAQRLFAAQGLCLFCLNFVLFYHAEKTVPSGLVALICSGISFCNILGMRVVYGQPVAPRVLLGSSIGVVGIVVVFWPEVSRFSGSPAGWWGVGLAVLATLSASAGNLISVAQRRANLPVAGATAWSMAWGALLTGLGVGLLGLPLSVGQGFAWWASLAWLVVMGSVVAFLCYLTLIARLGADRAAYVNIAVPVVALSLSALFEDFHWQTATVLGIVISLFGNWLVLSRGPTRA